MNAVPSPFQIYYAARTVPVAGQETDPKKLNFIREEVVEATIAAVYEVGQRIHTDVEKGAKIVCVSHSTVIHGDTIVATALVTYTEPIKKPA